MLAYGLPPYAFSASWVLVPQRSTSSQVGFEVILFVFTWWNALSRPRTNDAALVKQLYWDGSIVFFVRRLSYHTTHLPTYIAGRIHTESDEHDHLDRGPGTRYFVFNVPLYTH